MEPQVTPLYHLTSPAEQDVKRYSDTHTRKIIQPRAKGGLIINSDILNHKKHMQSSSEPLQKHKEVNVGKISINECDYFLFIRILPSANQNKTHKLKYKSKHLSVQNKEKSFLDNSQ